MNAWVYVVILSFPSRLYLGENRHWVSSVREAKRFATRGEAESALGSYQGHVVEILK